MNSSSNWSTTSTGVPRRRTRRWSSPLPGRRRARTPPPRDRPDQAGTSRPHQRRLATPGRARHHQQRGGRSRSRHAATSLSRPKNVSVSRRRRAPVPCTGTAPRSSAAPAGQPTSRPDAGSPPPTPPARHRVRSRAVRRGCGGRASAPAGRRPGGRSDTTPSPGSPNGARATAPRPPAPRRSPRRRDAHRTPTGHRAAFPPPRAATPRDAPPRSAPATTRRARRTGAPAPQLQRPPEGDRRPIGLASDRQLPTRSINSSNRDVSNSSPSTSGGTTGRRLDRRGPSLRRSRSTQPCTSFGHDGGVVTPQRLGQLVRRQHLAAAPPTPTTRPDHAVARHAVAVDAQGPSSSIPRLIVRRRPDCQPPRYRRDTATAPPAIPVLPQGRTRNTPPTRASPEKWRRSDEQEPPQDLDQHDRTDRRWDADSHAIARRCRQPAVTRRQQAAESGHREAVSQAHVCPAVDLVPEGLPPAGSDSSSAENGSGDLPGHRPVVTSDSEWTGDAKDHPGYGPVDTIDRATDWIDDINNRHHPSWSWHRIKACPE